ncbi:MAG: NAD-dependent malic enzyme [Planctomycetes bacterium]|nr:NAD-dependent malic enzyme [Planctomycetota bacterium]MCB9910281.1 NAD-dependent malic enzyme [Planctomycetota bacterium]HPF13435.1 NAD-dependent malic enzyme [Planctomycetota bacterium]HRV81458.1 NAD-dependent malic enzyme [Planctomycetota bacterium]
MNNPPNDPYLVGAQRMRDPLLNRGSAFTHEERERFSLEGLLPAGVSDQSSQSARVQNTLRSLHEPLAKYRELMALQDLNEYLFYRVLIDHLSELMPIVYTPTVGEAAQKFSDVFQRGRGLWITPAHKGRMREVIATALGAREIQLLVVTDNESILGLGDQGAGGMTISIGKLALYTACAGIAPETTLPISLDFGTNNPKLLGSRTYLGWPAKRLEGKEYAELIEEFVVAVEALFPFALVQWEDFRKDNALRILDRYRERILSFNDDIQGTGAVTLAGVYSGLRIAGRKLTDQRILIYGAGAAGLGIARQIKAALRMADVPEDQLQRHIGVLDSRGVLVDQGSFADAYKHELAWSPAWAEELGIGEDRSLERTVEAFRATVLIGTSGQGGAFTERIVRAMAGFAHRPIIMPLSNPTDNAEATPNDLVRWTEGRALVATGSPFEPVTFHGETKHIGQGNNVFIFPALGMASLVCGAKMVTDNMITRSAQALAEQLLPHELEDGLLYPSVSRLRAVTRNVTLAVIEQAIEDGVASVQSDRTPKELLEAASWSPEYKAL